MKQINKNNLILRRFGGSNTNIDFGVKVIVNQQTADGKGGLLWPAILRKLYLLYRYFDYDFTALAGDATKITKSALSEGYTTILAIGGKDTIREIIQGFFDKEYRLINPNARLVLFPLTFGHISEVLPKNAQNWDFLYHLIEGDIFLYQPHTVYLLDAANRKVRYSQRIFFEELQIQGNEPQKIIYENGSLLNSIKNILFVKWKNFTLVSLMEARIWLHEKGPMNIISPQIIVQQQMNDSANPLENLKLKIRISPNNWQQWNSFLLYNKLDKVRIEFSDRVFFKIDGIWDDAFGVMIRPTIDKIKMQWLAISHG